eukprot:2626588-Amphidinium_carterae.1
MQIKLDQLKERREMQQGVKQCGWHVRHWLQRSAGADPSLLFLLRITERSLAVYFCKGSTCATTEVRGAGNKWLQTAVSRGPNSRCVAVRSLDLVQLKG